MNWMELFAVGSIGFWLLLLVETVLLVALIERNKGAFATLSLAATLLLLHFLGDLNVYGFVVQHPLTLLAGVAGYFAAGTCWSVAKWWLYVRDQRSRYDELRYDFCQEHRLDGTIPEELQPRWLEVLAAANANGRKVEVRPQARRHKGQVLTWMTYWPWSLVWTVINDPVRKAFLEIYRHMHDHLQAISDRAFRGVEADFPAESAAGRPQELAH
jgi:hypothetical protein